MKHFAVIIILFLGITSQLSSQNSIFYNENAYKYRPQRKVVHKVWVDLKINSKPIKLKGFLYQAKDSSIVIMTAYNINHKISDTRNNITKLHKLELNINDIVLLRTRSVDQVGKGILYGALIGGLAGAIIGFNNYNDDIYGTVNAIILAVPGAIIGGGMGAIIGTIRMPIRINGNVNNYNKNKNIIIHKCNY